MLVRNWMCKIIVYATLISLDFSTATNFGQLYKIVKLLKNTQDLTKL